jgi:two-component system chemotaxis response regulator CheY
MPDQQMESLKCLVVDDHGLMRKITKDNLTAMGIVNIDTAENGKVAYEKITSSLTTNPPLYDIMFLDWSLPEVDGYTLLKQCRQDPLYDNLAIIMVTAETEKDRIIMALKAGATAYIQKPFTSEEFKQKFMYVVKWIEEKNKE